jgi:hypothetical protein
VSTKRRIKKPVKVGATASAPLSIPIWMFGALNVAGLGGVPTGLPEGSATGHADFAIDGALLKNLFFDFTGSVPYYLPIKLEYLQLTKDDGAGGTIVRYTQSGDSAWGVSVENCRVFTEQGYAFSHTTDGVTIRGGQVGDDVTCRFNTFDNLGKAVTTGSGVTGGVNDNSVIEHNIYLNGTDDYNDLGSTNTTATTVKPGVANIQFRKNCGIGGVPPTGAHFDWIQSLGILDNISQVVFGILEKCSYVTDVLTINDEKVQGHFMGDSGGTAQFLNAIFRNLVYCGHSQHAINLAHFTDPLLAGCVFIDDLWPVSNGPQILMSNGVGGTIRRCITSRGFSMPTQTGTITQSNNIIVTKSVPAYLTMWPNWKNGDFKGPDDVLLSYTPAERSQENGGVILPDGTVAGQLFPAAGGARIGAWNDESVYNPSNSVWVAAHPPASFMN